jgi:hypothetical protein
MLEINNLFMKKIKINAFANLLILLIFLLSFFSGIVLFKILPSGNDFQGDRNFFFEKNYFLSLSKHQWTDLHNITSLIFSGLILIHLILHLPWIKSFPKIFLRKEGKNDRNKPKL